MMFPPPLTGETSFLSDFIDRSLRHHRTRPDLQKSAAKVNWILLEILLLIPLTILDKI
jgi:hypothetical protein